MNFSAWIWGGTSKSGAEPVLVTGMHRSGTGAVVSCLRKLGLFTGWDLDANGEARFFVRLDEAILAATDARWDRPVPCAAALADGAAARRLAGFVSEKLDSPMIARYSGPANALLRRFPWLEKRPWGWKDPRLVFTMPVWLEIFPRLRVVLVTRHGVDVAASLARRSSLAATSSSVAASPETSELEGAFELWEEYMKHGHRILKSSGAKCLCVRFEELVSRPSSVLAELASFCGLAPAEKAIGEASASLDKGRALTHRKNPVLRVFALARRGRLAAWGYGEEE